MIFCFSSSGRESRCPLSISVASDIILLQSSVKTSLKSQERRSSTRFFTYSVILSKSPVAEQLLIASSTVSLRTLKKLLSLLHVVNALQRDASLSSGRSFILSLFSCRKMLADDTIESSTLEKTSRRSAIAG